MTDPVPYMERTRRYYAAQGFEKPYVWAHFDDVPFAPLAKPLSRSTLTVITTAALHDRRVSDPRSVASFDAAHLPERLYANDLEWDKRATHMEDMNAYLPVGPLRDCVASGRIGALAPRLHCAPTEYSIRRTLTADAPELLRRCREDHADLAFLVPL